MINLIKLELRKSSMKGTLFMILIVNLLMLWIVYLTMFNENLDNINQVKYEYVFFILESMITFVYIIIGSVLCSKYIVKEYRTGTIFVMHLYPTSKEKIFIAKMITVFGVGFLLAFGSYLFVFFGFILINQFFTTITEPLTQEIIISQLIKTGICVVVFLLIGMLPLMFAIIKRSNFIIIIGSIVMGLILSSLIENYLVTPINSVTIGLSMLSIILMYFTKYFL